MSAEEIIKEAKLTRAVCKSNGKHSWKRCDGYKGAELMVWQCTVCRINVDEHRKQEFDDRLVNE